MLRFILLLVGFRLFGDLFRLWIYQDGPDLMCASWRRNLVKWILSCMLLTMGAMSNMAWGTDGTRSVAFVMWFTFYHLVISMIVNLVCDFFCCKCLVSFCCWWHLDSCRRFVLTLAVSRWSWPYVCVVKMKSCEMNSFDHIRYKHDIGCLIHGILALSIFPESVCEGFFIKKQPL